MLSLPTAADTLMPKVIDTKLSDGKLLMTTLEHARADTKRSVWPAITVGLLGSVLMTIGSLSVGWVAHNSVINATQWLAPFRTTETGVITGTVLLTVGAWGMIWGWLRLGRVLRRPAHQFRGKYEFAVGGMRTINWAVAIWSVPQLFALTIFSRDMLAYLNQGRQVLAGQNPYESGISNLPNWFQLGTDTMWAEDATPYGPMFLWIEAAVVRITGVDQPDMAIFLFRLVSLVGVAMIMYYLPKLAEMQGWDPARAQWIAAANPLFIISFVASGHNDSLMVGFMLAAIYAVWRGRGLLAVTLMTVSIGMKLISIVLLPFIGLWWAGRNASWRRIIGHWAMTLGLTTVIMVLVGWLNGYGLEWVKVIAGTGSIFSYWAPVGALSEFARIIVVEFGWGDGELVMSAVRLAGRVLSVVVVVILMFWGKTQHILVRATWSFAAIVVLSPVIHPWYLLWLLPLFVLLGIRSNWQLRWVIFTVVFFIAYGAGDQLYVWQFLDIGDAMKQLSWLISLVLAVWVLYYDPWTSPMFKNQWHVRQTWRRGILTYQRWKTNREHSRQ